MEEGQLWRQYVIAGIANIAIVNLGYVMGWTSPVLPKLNDATVTPLPELITVDQGAWIGSLLTVGAIFGPFVAGFLAPRIGRKWGLMATSVPLFVGWILIAAATNVALIYAGRIFWGISVGMLFTLSPIYCAEIATDDSRGALGSYLQVFSSKGFLLVYAIGPYISYSAIAYVGVALMAMFNIAFFFMPESPIYLLTKDDREGAGNCLANIRGNSRAAVEAELNKMAAEVKASMEKKATIADVFRGSNLKAFYITCALMFFQQFSGQTAVLFYSSTIFSAAGSTLDASIATIIIGSVLLAASAVTPFVIDRLGKRFLLLVSSAGTAIGHGLLGIYFILDENKHPLAESLGFLPVLSLVLFVVSYCWGLGPLPFAVMGEMFPVEVKAVASPIVTSFCRLMTFFVTRYFEPIANAAGMYVAFWIFGVCCIGAFFFTLFLVPETKGKSFQEIQDMLAGRSPSKSEKA